MPGPDAALCGGAARGRVHAAPETGWAAACVLAVVSAALLVFAVYQRLRRMKSWLCADRLRRRRELERGLDILLTGLTTILTAPGEARPR